MDRSILVKKMSSTTGRGDDDVVTSSSLMEEAMTKIVFCRLDPTLRQLLATFQEYRILVVQQQRQYEQGKKKRDDNDDDFDHNNNNNNNNNHLERLIHLLKHQVKLLHDLQTNIQETAKDILDTTTTTTTSSTCTSNPQDQQLNSKSKQELPSNHDIITSSTTTTTTTAHNSRSMLLFSKSLVVLSDYILLPIISILKHIKAYVDDDNPIKHPNDDVLLAQNNNPQQQQQQQQRQQQQQQRLDCIRQAAQRECVQAAARTLATFLMTIQQGGGGGGDSSRNTAGYGKSSSWLDLVDQEEHEDESSTTTTSPSLSASSAVDNHQKSTFPLSQWFGGAVAVVRIQMDKVVHGLITCAAALPTAKHLFQLQQRGQQKDQFFSLDAGTADNRDIGEECCDALLHAVRRLIQDYHDENDNQNPANGNDPNSGRNRTRTVQPRPISSPIFMAALVQIVDVCCELIHPTHQQQLQRQQQPGRPILSLSPSSSASSLVSPSLRATAIATLDSLLQHVPDKVDGQSFWSELFPGCFRSLCGFLMAELQTAFAVSTPKVGAKAIETFARFLHMALPNSVHNILSKQTSIKNNDKAATEPDSALEESLEQLKRLALTTNNNATMKEGATSSGYEANKTLVPSSACTTSTTINSEDSSKRDKDDAAQQMFRNVHFFIPIALMKLVSLLAATRAELARQSAPVLCRVLLSDKVATCWDSSKTTTASSCSHQVSIAALECCLILANDPHDNVAKSARNVLRRAQLEEIAWQFVISGMVPRLEQLMGENPTLTQNHQAHPFHTRQTISLDNRLKLIVGYLDLLLSTKIMMTAAHNSDKNVRISRSVVTKLVNAMTTCRVALSGLFDIDFTNNNYTISGTQVEQAIANEYDAMFDESPGHFRYKIGIGTVRTAESMVHRLGKLIGTKNAVVFVDECVADTFEAMSPTFVESSCSRDSQSLNELVGRLILASHVLKGAFSGDYVSSAKTSSSQRRDKRANHLSTLASSILPLLCSPFLLLHLPQHMHVENGADISPTEQLIPTGCGNSIQIFVNGESRALSKVGRKPLTATRGNHGWFSCSVLELMAVVFTTLRDDADRFIPQVITPIVEVTVTHHDLYVRQHAISVLRRLARCCGLANSAELVNQNFDHLIGTLLGRLRVPGGHSPRVNSREVDDHLGSLSSIVCFVLRQASESETKITEEENLQWSPPLLKETKLSLMIQLVSALLNRFDQSIARSKSADVVATMVKVCNASMLHLCSVYAVEKRRQILSQRCGKPTVSKLWKEGLFSLRKGRGLHRVSGPKSDAEITTNCHDETRVFLDVGNTEIDFVAILLTRCCYSLSHPELTVQIASCDCIEDSFKYLSSVENTRTTAGDDETTRNIVLEQVSETWPALISRFRALSLSLCRNSSDGKGFDGPSLATEAVLLARLFRVVAVMSEVSGEFFSSRFENDVWPLTAMVLSNLIASSSTQSCLLNASHSEQNRRRRERITCNHQFFSPSGRSLQIAVLSCFTRVFEQRECGQALSNLIPAIGITLLPFLEDDSEIGDTAAQTIRAMMRIDCDALWLPLWNLSGREWSKRPLRPLSQNAKTSLDVPPAQLLSAIRAMQLLDYAEAIPEQCLESGS